MHDIGKIIVSDNILKKPGRLTVDEFDLMKKHAEVGGTVVKEVLSGWDAQNVVNRSISKTWKLVIVVGLIAQMAACSYSIINTEIAQEANKPVDEAWTAQSIPMPHMTDGSRYVSNPDGIISPQTEALINKQLPLFAEPADLL